MKQVKFKINSNVIGNFVAFLIDNGLQTMLSWHEDELFYSNYFAIVAVPDELLEIVQTSPFSNNIQKH